jgi:hypothetical protein
MTDHCGLASPIVTPRMGAPVGLAIRCGRPQPRNSGWFKAWRIYTKAADFLVGGFLVVVFQFQCAFLPNTLSTETSGIAHAEVSAL